MSQQEAQVRGLTVYEAARRLALDGPNELPRERPRSLLASTWAVVREPMILLLLAAALVSFLLADPLEAAVLLMSVLVVAAISLYQQRKTESALAALRQLSAPRALVVRDGSPRRVAGREVVRDDLVLLAEGDRVPADGIVLSASHLAVDEAALTGESLPVVKEPISGASARRVAQFLAASAAAPGAPESPIGYPTITSSASDSARSCTAWATD